GFDEVGTSGRTVQGPPDLSDRGIDARLHVDEHIIAPQPRDDVLSCHQLPASLNEQDQQIHRLALEPNRLAAAPQLVAPRVELEVCESKHLADLRRPHGVFERGYGAITPLPSPVPKVRKSSASIHSAAGASPAR